MVKKTCNECGRSFAFGAEWEIGRNTHFKKSVRKSLTFFLKVW